MYNKYYRGGSVVGRRSSAVGRPPSTFHRQGAFHRTSAYHTRVQRRNTHCTLFWFATRRKYRIFLITAIILIARVWLNAQNNQLLFVLIYSLISRLFFTPPLKNARLNRLRQSQQQLLFQREHLQFANVSTPTHSYLPTNLDPVPEILFL